MWVLGTSSFLTDEEIGNSEDIDRFAIPRGILTWTISVLRSAEFSYPRAEIPIEKRPRVRVTT